MTSRSIETKPQTLFGHIGQFTSVLEQEEDQSHNRNKIKTQLAQGEDQNEEYDKIECGTLKAFGME